MGRSTGSRERSMAAGTWNHPDAVVRCSSASGSTVSLGVASAGLVDAFWSRTGSGRRSRLGSWHERLACGVRRGVQRRDVLSHTLWNGPVPRSALAPEPAGASPAGPAGDLSQHSTRLTKMSSSRCGGLSSDAEAVP